MLIVKNIILREQNFSRQDNINGNIDFELKVEIRTISKDKLYEVTTEQIGAEVIITLTGRLSDKSVAVTLNSKHLVIYEFNDFYKNSEEKYIQDETRSIMMPYIRESVHSITLKAGIPGLIIP